MRLSLLPCTAECGGGVTEGDGGGRGVSKCAACAQFTGFSLRLKKSSVACVRCMSGFWVQPVRWRRPG